MIACIFPRFDFRPVDASVTTVDSLLPRSPSGIIWLREGNIMLWKGRREEGEALMSATAVTNTLPVPVFLRDMVKLQQVEDS